MFDDIINKVDQLKRNAERLDGEHDVRLTELFPEEFMLRQTEFTSISQMIDESGFNVANSDDFAAVPELEWDRYVKERTRFASWDEMKNAAVQEWIRAQLGLQ